MHLGSKGSVRFSRSRCRARQSKSRSCDRFYPRSIGLQTFEWSPRIQTRTFMTFDPKPLLSRIRVPAGFVFAALYLYFSTPSSWSLWIGGSLAFVGIVIRAWATGHIRKNDELTVSGPYALTRNPLYLGSFIIGMGFSIAGGNLIIPAVFLI